MFAQFDLSASYRIPGGATTITVQGQNLAGCIGGTSTAPVTGLSSSAKYTYAAGQQCSFGQPHVELLDVPAIGPMVFVGIRRERR